MTDQVDKPVGVQNLPPSLTYFRNGDPITTFMSFGLLNVLMQSIGNYGNVGMVGMDPFINDLVLKKFLVLRNKNGKPTEFTVVDGKERLTHELENIFDVDVSTDDIERILFFIQVHMADFTLRTLKNAAGVNVGTQTAQKALSDSMSGQTGSPNSASKTPAA